MSIKSLLTAAFVGFAALVLTGCVADRGAYYYDDGRYYGSGHYAGAALVYHSGPRYVHPRVSRPHRSYRPHRPRYERPKMQRERRQARRQESRPPRHEERRQSDRRRIAQEMADRARMQERSWP